MGVAPLTDEALIEIVDAYKRASNNKEQVARDLGIPASTVKARLRVAARRGFLGYKPTLDGFEIARISSTLDANGNVKASHIQQKPERELSPFNLPQGHVIKGISALVDANGNVQQSWYKTAQDAVQRDAAMRAAVEAFKEDMPRAEAVPAPISTLSDLLCQYTITDAHLGALAWNEETGGGDYDLSIGEKLIMDWFSAAIASAPAAKRAVLAQLGDFLHYDSFKSITPEHGHLLDGDTRYPKMVRAAIRIVRKISRMLLEKHGEVWIIMADANHDPSSEVWLRELLAAFFEDEPRIHVDTNPGTYSVVEHGNVSLFYHHGHRRGVKNVDSVLVGKFREIYGRTRFSYAHTGHKHSDELITTNLMKVEQHETLAAPDAYAANGGWLSGRSAKVIIYHAEYGEVGRSTLTPEMVAS